MRAAAGLSPITFTDSVLPGLPINVLHVQELRAALDPARTVLGLAPIS